MKKICVSAIYVWKFMTDGENKMKYEFHIGDYVETKDGWVGYVTTIDQYWSKVCTCWGLHIIGNIQRNNNKDKLDIDIAQINRIGQYDFTKKEEDKIEPLACETTSDYSNEKLRKKINELVEAVNELRRKYESD